jgi:hypothetical protein
MPLRHPIFIFLISLASALLSLSMSPSPCISSFLCISSINMTLSLFLSVRKSHHPPFIHCMYSFLMLHRYSVHSDLLLFNSDNVIPIIPSDWKWTDPINYEKENKTDKKQSWPFNFDLTIQFEITESCYPNWITTDVNSLLYLLYLRKSHHHRLLIITDPDISTYWIISGFLFFVGCLWNKYQLQEHAIAINWIMIEVGGLIKFRGKNFD